MWGLLWSLINSICFRGGIWRWARIFCLIVLSYRLWLCKIFLLSRDCIALSCCCMRLRWWELTSWSCILSCCPLGSKCVSTVLCCLRIFCSGVRACAGCIAAWMFLLSVRCRFFLRCRLLWWRWLYRLSWGRGNCCPRGSFSCFGSCTRILWWWFWGSRLCGCAFL